MKFRFAIISALAVTISAGPAATARTEGQRLDSPKPRSEPDGSDPARAGLGVFVLRGIGTVGPKSSTKVRSLPFAASDIGLVLDLARMTTRRRNRYDSAEDGYALRQWRFKSHVPVGEAVDLVVLGDALYMKRQVLSVPATARIGRVLGASAGIGIEGDGWIGLVRYETVGTKRRALALHRMAEILGGAPRNSEGVELQVTRRAPASNSRRVEGSLVARMSSRSPADLALMGASPARRSEASLEASVRLEF